MADNATMTIPRDVLEPIIQARVSTAIAEALGQNGLIIQKAVESALLVKVDSNGKPESYSSRDSVTFLQWLVNDAIRNAAKKAMVEQLEGQLDDVKKAVAAELKKQRSPLIRSLIEGIAATATNPNSFRYGLKVEVSAGER